MTRVDDSAQRLSPLAERKAELVEALRSRNTSGSPALRPYPRGKDSVSQQLGTSWAQRRLWFIDQLEGGSPAYNVSVKLRLSGTLDFHALQRALDALCQRHEVLRTTFVSIAGDPRQLISDHGQIPIVMLDLSGCDATERDARAEAQELEDTRTTFDLKSGPLVRCRLLRMTESEHLLLLTVHHIIWDAWSAGVLLGDVSELYAAEVECRRSLLPPLAIQYADYAQWQREWLQGRRFDAQLTYWRQHLDGAPSEIELPTDRPRQSMPRYRGENVKISLGAETSTGLGAVARQNGMTLFMVLFGAWAIVLSRLSGHDDIVIGTPVANRRRAELEGLIGFFVNTLPIRTIVPAHGSLENFLRHLKEEMLNVFDHQDLPFEQLVEALRPQRSLNRHPIFQVMFALQNVPRSEIKKFGLSLSLEEGANTTAKFDLLLSLEERGGVVSGLLNYDADLFDRGTIESWASCFGALLKGMVTARSVALDSLSMLPTDERDQVLEVFNSSQRNYPDRKLIHQVFEQQVRRTPDAIALSYEGRSVTFSELNTQANRLARYLRARGIERDTIVGVSAERGLEMVVEIMGVLKAGGAYLPLDPSYPSDRLAQMIRDAAPRVLLTQKKLRDRLPPVQVDVIAVDQEWGSIQQHSEHDLDAEATAQTSDQLAYVIYTSGSTGKPKGVMIEHRHVLNLWQGLEEFYEDCEQRQRVGLNASLNFDASVQQLVQLLSGRSVFIIPQECRQDANTLLKFLEESRIAAVDCTPSQLRSWLAAGLMESRRIALRLVIVGGEAIDAELWARLAKPSGIEFVNVYGPTECTVDATAARVTNAGSRPHIGRPMPNRRVYILDRHRQPLSVGLTGEIYIGGAGVARGYLHRTELTTERFVRDPFVADPNGRMYKTGDLGRWHPDGTIEYLGRNDQQVKIRGIRIELGEIEAHLLRHEHLKDAAVIVRADSSGDKRLVAYVVPESAELAPSAEMLRAFLKALIPEAMVPTAFVRLERMPLTPSGKLDRRALPEPEIGDYSTSHYEMPEGEIEEILVGIWQNLLRVARVGRHDNFFALGGHSLLIMQMMERLRSFGLSCTVRQVFECNTLADLARTLTPEADTRIAVPPNLIPPDCQSITPSMLTLVKLEPKHIAQIAREVPGGICNIQDIYPLAPLQEGILFHHLLDETGGDVYVAHTLLVGRSLGRLGDLIGALQMVIDRHDVLRTAIYWHALPEPVQVVYRRAELPVESLAFSRESEAQHQIELWRRAEQQRLDLNVAPLLRLRAATTADGGWRALLQMHHIVGDATSAQKVMDEVAAYLEGRAERLQNPLPYRNHVAQALAYAKNRDAADFFRKKLADVDEPTAPFGIVNTHGDGAHLDDYQQDLNSVLVDQLHLQARSMGVSAATLFHAAWALVVARTSGRDDVVFGSVLLGRIDAAAETHRILGMFVNTLPLRLRLRDMNARQLLDQTQRELVELLSREQASLTVAQRCSGVVGSMPLFTSLLNYRHAAIDEQEHWNVSDIEVHAGPGHTNYPFTLSIDDRPHRITLKAQADRSVGAHRLIEFVCAALQSLLDALGQSEETPVLRLTILPLPERRKVVELFNATDRPFPYDRPVHTLFEERVCASPHATAAVDEGNSISYQELNERSNQLARFLQRRGAVVGDYIPVLMSRSLQMLVAQLAVMKCGCVYVPMDPGLPASRLAFMIRDCAASRILVQGAAGIELDVPSLEEVDCEAVARIIERESAENLTLEVERHPPAYVMYTSGSTGTPKGVVVPHRGITRLVINSNFVQIEPTDCIAHYSAPAFDASTFEIWGALLNGARVAIVRQEVVLDSVRFAELLLQERVTLMYMSVGLFNQYSTVLASVFKRLKYLIVGGDSLDPANIRRVLRDSAPGNLLNGYGPTECTTFSATHHIVGVEEDATTIPIGKPIANSRIYILDEYRQPLPVGVTGELYIGGAGVALGYLNRRELTDERFVPDPFSIVPQAHLYRTGDLGRWRPDGVVEFVGRNDYQVKIRGFRIELGEIEARLSRHPRVKEVIVQARQDIPGEKQLVAYVLPTDADNAPTTEEMRAYLLAELPEYMVPSAFVTMDQFQLTATGKVDRRALPAPSLQSYTSRQYVEPEGPMERNIAIHWAAVLGLQAIGRHDNFFELGGHSLLAVKAVAQMNQELSSNLRITDLYQSPTVAQLAALIRDGSRNDVFLQLRQEAHLDDDIRPITGSGTVQPPRAVLLTGATGFVGRFLLAQLLEDTEALVYCLVRAPSERQALSRVRVTLSRWDLWHPRFEGRVVAVTGDLRLPRLGIKEDTYDLLRKTIDSIYHCGTSMNHLETYAMAKAANVGSTRELLRLATQSKPKLINYISTLGVFTPDMHASARLVDERTLIDNERHSDASGYIASKWVSEKIIITAADRGIPCNIFRLGLVWADSQQGRYDDLQRGYRILKSCLLAGLGIQDYRHELPPTPVDYVARAIVQLSMRHPDGQAIFHLSAARNANDGLFERYNAIGTTSLHLVPFYEWVREIDRLQQQGTSLPVVPLVQFAFGMSKERFEEYQRSMRLEVLSYDCNYTLRELEKAGVAEPDVDNEVLRACLQSMLRRDDQLRDLGTLPSSQDADAASA